MRRLAFHAKMGAGAATGERGLREVEVHVGLPDFLSPLFWDVDPASLLPGHEWFVIERILNYGDIPAIRWMWRTFGDEAVVAVVRGSRRLTRKAATFWALVYGVPPEDVRSLAKEGWGSVSSGRS